MWRFNKWDCLISFVQQTLTKNLRQLLDVREVDEYEEEHIPESVNIPLSNLEKIQDMHYAKDTPLFVYCHSGRRSGAAVMMLRGLGYTNAKNIGGIMHYKKA